MYSPLYLEVSGQVRGFGLGLLTGDERGYVGVVGSKRLT